MNSALEFVKRFWRWLVSALAVTVIVAKIGGVVDWLRNVLADGVIAVGPIYRLSATAGWLIAAVILVSGVATVALVELFYENRVLKRKLLEGREKADKTLTGMLDAATRIVHRLYPEVGRFYLLEKVLYEYFIEEDGTATVKVTHKIRAHDRDLHFWRLAFAAQPAAPAMPYLIDLDFKVWDISDIDDTRRVDYLLTKNESHAKELSVFFLPLITVGEGAREICYSFKWPKLMTQLLRDGAEDFGFQVDSRGRVQEVGVAVMFNSEVHKIYKIACSLTIPQPGEKLDDNYKTDPDWKGWRYSVCDGPAEGTSYLLHFTASARKAAH